MSGKFVLKQIIRKLNEIIEIQQDLIELSQSFSIGSEFFIKMERKYIDMINKLKEEIVRLSIK